MHYPTFPLDEQGWIPVVDGPPVGLVDALTHAHELRLAATGPEYTALIRVLTVIAARITGLDQHTTVEEWAERRAEVYAAGRLNPDQVHAYFEARAGRFDLFDSARPWMQDPRLREQCPKTSGVWKLTWGRGTPDRPAHFWDAPLDLPVEAAEAARLLLTQLMFSAAGKVTARQVGSRRASVVGVGPLRGSVSYHPRGRTLFDDLVLGMPFVARTGPDEAPWDAPLPDPLAPLPTPQGVASLVLGRYRHALLLIPSGDGETVVDAYVTWGAQAGEDQTPDPWLLSAARKDGTRYVPLADAQRPLWRDLPALATPESAPPVWTALRAHPVPLPDRVDVQASGMVQDRGKSRDHATVFRHLAVGAALLDPEQQAVLLARAALAEEARRALQRALREAENRAVPTPGQGDTLAQYDLDVERWVATGHGELPRTVAMGLWERLASPQARASFKGLEAYAAGQRLIQEVPLTPESEEQDQPQEEAQPQEVVA